MFLDLLSLVTDLFVTTDRSVEEGGDSMRLTISASESEVSDISSGYILDLDYLLLELHSFGCLIVMPSLTLSSPVLARY